jgi:hypothetical protein
MKRRLLKHRNQTTALTLYIFVYLFSNWNSVSLILLALSIYFVFWFYYRRINNGRLKTVIESIINLNWTKAARPVC